MKIRNQKEFLTLLKGATFLAAGGGGPFSLGKEIVETYFKDIKEFEIDIINSNQLNNSEWVSIAAGMGQPSASTTFSPQAVVNPTVNAIKAMEKLIKELLITKNDKRFESFEKFNALSPIEVGAINVAIPLISAYILQDNIFVVDGDAAGRSVPTIDLTPFATTQPVMPNMATSDGDEYEFTVMSLKNYQDLGTAYSKLMEAGLIGDVTGLCLAPMSGETLNNGNIVKGTLTDAYNIGIMFEENLSSDERIKKIQTYLNTKAQTPRQLKLICTGKVTAYTTQTEDVTDLGYLTINTDDNRVFTILIQNENIIGQFDDETYVTITGPDSICYLAKKDGPLDQNEIYENVLISEKFSKGEDVYIHVIAIEAADVIKKNEKLMASWNAAYKTSRYYGPYSDKLWTECK
ncbi:DUF917 family protein [Sulfuricurvum sp.]|uniref:S-methyl thiohydantoin desulfurase domain-containing protein n=1 Tax=Sulfuricurvum sp. TaxID=2025608 RepID=UPI00260F18EC|nr:DUF917 family protein [Sulfuricurvum sp.]MDD2781440.1 DUF917 family protein [Sulfuricurvum sp.]